MPSKLPKHCPTIELCLGGKTTHHVTL
jgi:hypothetical protein